jgi:hypothetical protein
MLEDCFEQCTTDYLHGRDCALFEVPFMYFPEGSGENYGNPGEND